MTNIEVTDLVNSFDKHFNKIKIWKSQKESKLIGICKAALTKSFEFVQISTSNEEKNEFFYLSGLRGICEELIATTYIINNLNSQQLEDLIEFYYTVEQEKTLLRQFNFFWKYKPMQCVVPPNETRTEDELFHRIRNDKKGNETKKIAKEKGIALLPSTWKMAEQTNYQDLYQYIYYITSEAVHFNITNFFKIGWGDINENKQIETSAFSTKHNSVQFYCKEFNICYGLILFVELSTRLKSILNLSEEYILIVEELIKLIKKNRFPAFITHHHMNMSEKEMKEKYISYAEKYAT